MKESLGRYVNWHVFRCKNCGLTFVRSSATLKCPCCNSLAIDVSWQAHVCSDCGTIMDEGYVLYDGEAYYCSDSCLYEHFSEDDYEEAFHQDEACWMEWYE